MYVEFSKAKTKISSNFVKRQHITKVKNSKKIGYKTPQQVNQFMPMQQELKPEDLYIALEGGELRDRKLKETKDRYKKGNTFSMAAEGDTPLYTNVNTKNKEYLWLTNNQTRKSGYVNKARILPEVPKAVVIHTPLIGGDAEGENNMVGGLKSKHAKYSKLYHAHFKFKDVQDLPTGRHDNIGFHSKYHEAFGIGELYSVNTERFDWSQQLVPGKIIYDEKMLVEAIWLNDRPEGYMLVKNDCQTWVDKVLTSYHTMIASSKSADKYREERIKRNKRRDEKTYVSRINEEEKKYKNNIEMSDL